MITNFEFHGSTAYQENLIIKEFISIPTGKERITEYTIPGRDGSLQCREGTFDNIVISVKLVYMEKPDNIREKYQDSKGWLINGAGNILRFSDYSGFHYIVEYVEIDSNDIELLSTGTFVVNFVCKPHRYADGGDLPVEFSGDLFNPYETAHPQYQVSGEGMCAITVNGKGITANVGGNLVIDTDLMIAYRNGVMRNTSISGDYSNLYLTHGNNELKITDGFQVKIIPRWRCL